MPPIEYDFDERLAMSQGVSATADVYEILVSNIPGAVNVISAHKTNDRNGTDLWVEMSYGGFVSVDVKARGQDWSAKPPPNGADDLALETFSVIEKNVVGWTRNSQKRTDYILWLWKDTGRWCLVPFRFLCRVMEDNWETWRRVYKTKKQYTPRKGASGYHSECVFVPREIVWREIYTYYSGRPQRNAGAALS